MQEPETTESEPEPLPSFNILSLDGAGVDGLISAYVLNKTERLAYNISEDLGLSVPSDNGRVAIKDILQMTASASMSSLITMGLTIPKPEQNSEPAYYSEDLIKLYSVKSADMETLVLHDDHSFVMAIWFSTFIVCSYYFGKIKFDNDNIEKAYDVLDELIKRDIKKLKGEQIDHNLIDCESNDSCLNKKIRKKITLKNELQKQQDQEHSDVK